MQVTFSCQVLIPTHQELEEKGRRLQSASSLEASARQDPEVFQARAQDGLWKADELPSTVVKK